MQFGSARPDPVQPGTVSGVLFALRVVGSPLAATAPLCVIITHTSSLAGRPSVTRNTVSKWHFSEPCQSPVHGTASRTFTDAMWYDDLEGSGGRLWTS